ncbi:SulP family inorganic anion transporter [Sinosporangium siamense]|uniref:carbonic anhydrase n=1 Tax=Sinosporangium siamense TaxID=1367973 RepID=A0A919RS68_9ACTN|nr:SulP family inorganic anion transporter [Sinosporangium siamense]GII97571.1 transporter [Sinosporangium siamense]
MSTDTLSDGASTPSRLRSVLRHDLPASLVVFLVAIPLSLGIAVASGAPLAAGLIAAVVGGVVAGALGGSAVQVSGPAAGLALVVADLVHTYGWRATCMITLLAGVAQLLLGLSKVARAALAVSPAVVHGTLTGVGVTIALAQLHVVLGGSPQHSALANLIELPAQLLANHSHAVAAGLLTITVLVVWTRLPRRLRSVPAPLVALATTAAAAAALSWDVTHVDLTVSPSTWVSPFWPKGDWHGIVAAVLLVALLSGIESLLCSVGVDKLHSGPKSDLDRVLTGQGVANIVTGALGGLPVAGVVVRSTANVTAGAKSKWSTVMHGCWVLAFTFGFAWTIRYIPMEALAALLVFIGVQMVNLGHVRNLRGHGEVPVYLVTAAGVVFVGLAEGAMLGVGLAALLALRRLTWVTVDVGAEPSGRWHVLIGGSLTFLGVPRLTAELNSVPPGVPVDLDLNIDFMDNAAFEALHTWRLAHEGTGGTVDIDELHDEWYSLAAKGARVFPAKTPPSIPDRWWLPWAYRRRRLVTQGRVAALTHHARGRRRRAGAGDTAPAPCGDSVSWGEPASCGDPVSCGDSASCGESASWGAIPELVAGAREFHRHTAPLVRPILTRMARKQEPSHLFITCADSRVVPSLITASGPGDLFTVRNIGNLVPRHEAAPPDDSVVAAVEYATRVLGVRTITVCGHSGCGAMAALLSGSVDADDLPGLRRWLEHGNHSLARYIATAGEGDEEGGPLDRLCRVNVIQQLANLRTHPGVEELVRAERLELVGIYFDIAQARVHILGQPDPTPPADLRVS